MAEKHFTLRARVSTENPDAVRPMLRQMVPGGVVTLTGDPKELIVTGEMNGPSGEELNRALLTGLRRVEKRTRLRAEWTCEGTTERFFDYVSKRKRTAVPGPSASV